MIKYHTNTGIELDLCGRVNEVREQWKRLADQKRSSVAVSDMRIGMKWSRSCEAGKQNGNAKVRSSLPWNNRSDQRY